MGSDRKTRVAELAAEHGPMVHAAAYRILGHADDAEDVYQDVFLKLLEGWRDRLKPGAVRNWGAFLRVSATRCAIDLLRRKKRRVTQSLDENIEAMDHATADPRRAAIGREQADQLRAALRQLPAAQAEVFALRCFEAMSYEEIAEALGISVSKIGVVLFRARDRLRKLIEDESRTIATPSRPTTARDKEQADATR